MNISKIGIFLKNHKKKIITIVIIVLVAWILGQLLVPMILKWIFL